jgi:hypothetical protein
VRQTATARPRTSIPGSTSTLPLGGDTADETAFWASPRVGQRVPDFTLPRLGDDGSVRLPELWRSRPLVMEFGSFT